MSQDDTTPIGPVLVTWEYLDYSVPEWYFETARAYLDSGLRMYIQLRDRAIPFTYHYARVAKHLCDHALELFFKGAILQANKKPTGTHELDQLYREFRGVCPGKKFDFTAMIDEMVKKNEERPASEYGRYPTGKDWKEWPGGYSYQDVGLRIREYSKLLEDFDRLVPLIKERYPD